MPQPTSANTKRAPQSPQARPLQQLEGPTSLELVAGDELGLITRDVALKTGAHTALLVAWNARERYLEVISACGTASSEDRLSLPATPSGFVGRVLESGRTAAEPVTPKENPRLAAPVSGARVTFAAGAPVRPPGGPPGVLCVGLPSRPGDLTTVMWVVESYARLASLCLHDAGTLDGLVAAARLDALTGCLNYAAIRSELEREIGRCARHGRTVACCFIDLDRFKQVNDRHGHGHGSRVLAEVARVLRGGVRIGDSVGRYGGDEFIVLLPDTGRAAAHLLAGRLRSMIHTATAAMGDEPLDASIGVAQWRPGTTGDELLAAADDALRSAKRAGGGVVRGGGNLVRAGDAAATGGRGVVGVDGRTSSTRDLAALARTLLHPAPRAPRARG